jgi:hypothetical protein
MHESHPNELPEIDRVDILILEGRGFGEWMRDMDTVAYQSIEGRSAQDIANLFRKLPSGNQARCHNPPFGLRFYREDGVRSQCSICWDCNNIDGDFGYEFDGGSSVARKLFSLLTKLSGVKPLGL